MTFEALQEAITNAKTDEEQQNLLFDNIDALPPAMRSAIRLMAQEALGVTVFGTIEEMADKEGMTPAQLKEGMLKYRLNANQLTVGT